MDAKSEYYKHGPLARMEIGHNQVQAMDYNYTIHGWLKGVNATSLKAENDPGKDGLENNFAKDEFGYNLNYYKGDYSAINQPNNGTNFLVETAQSDFETAQVNLYNGNISQMVTGIRQFMQGSTGPQGMNYTYDQLNRLKTARAYDGTMAQATNTWGTNTAKEDYGVDLNYDPNGNILHLERKGVASENIRMDEMDYEYETIANGYTKNTNRLKRVTDAVANGNYEEDIDNQLEEENYLYDKIGNLTRDKSEGLTITWNVQGKVKQVIHDNGKGDDLEFRYSATGDRIVKIVKPRTINGLQTPDHWKYTYYIKDASGNTMTIYEKLFEEVNATTYKEKLKVNDFHLYGSERLGTYTPKEDQRLVAEADINVVNVEDLVNNNRSVTTLNTIILGSEHYLGQKSYEGKNHLGNVLVVFADSKEALDKDNDGMIDSYEAVLISANDYYPFGSLMPNRKFTGVSYRYGFNGMERDDEVNGEGNSYDFGARVYDSRLGRWLSIDPYSGKYPSISPFSFVANSPLILVDPSGEWIAKIKEAKDGTRSVVFVAEQGDNLFTLEIQLGLEKGALSETGEGKYFRYSFETVKGSELKLDRLEEVQKINKFLNREDVEMTNCSNCALYVNGIVQKNAWQDEETGEFDTNSGPSVEVMEDATSFVKSDKFTNVSEENTKIGSIVVYKMTISEISNSGDVYNFYISYKRMDPQSEVFKQEMQKIHDEADPAHFSIVILKSKDGEKVIQVFEKAGTREPSITDLPEKNSPFEPATLRGEKTPFYNKNEENDTSE